MGSTFPAFESYGGRLEEFYDGHIPETFRFQQHEETNDMKSDGDNTSLLTPRIVRYDSSTSSANVHVYDGILHPHDARMLYEVTASSIPTQRKVDDDKSSDAPMRLLEGESPWGTYVTIQEALEWIEWKKLDGNYQYEHVVGSNFDEYIMAWKQQMLKFYKCRQANANETQLDEKKEEDHIIICNEDLDKHLDDMDNIRHALAVEAVATAFLQTVPSHPGTTFVASSSKASSSNQSYKDTTTLFQLSQILKEAHGVAVWALSSTAGNSVQYHIDYAELLRYENNVTVPPLWAGTIQCSSLWNDQTLNDDDQNQIMRGGEFCVNLRGLDHYSEHGYKGNISGDRSYGGWRRPTGDAGADQVHINDSNQWVTIPYAFNRCIVHRGDLPHLSAPVESIGSKDNDAQTSRVIVGFNVFGHDVGEQIAKAPEHSKPFRRKVRLYRSTINTCTSKHDKSDGGKTGMDLTQIRKNKGLTKLLVLAKREKVKEDLRRNQETLSCSIWQRILSYHASKGSPLLQVADIIQEFGSPNDCEDGTWPKSNDVHVHLHHLLRSTKSARDVSEQKRSPAILNYFQDSDGILSTPGKWYFIRTVNAAPSSDSSLEKKESGGLIPLSTALDIVEINKT